MEPGRGSPAAERAGTERAGTERDVQDTCGDVAGRLQSGAVR